MKKYLHCGTKLVALLLCLALILTLGACGKDETETEETTDGPINLNIWFHGSDVKDEASQQVLAELNKYLTEKINVTIEPHWGTWGDFDMTACTSLAANEAIDIYFTSGWSGDEYNRYARDGYWYKLDNLLPEYAPELLETIPEKVWNCAKTEGLDGVGIYAVPAMAQTASQNCWDVNGTMLAELGYDVDAVCEAGLDYFSPEFEEMLQKAKDAGGEGFYPLIFEPAVLERMVCGSSQVTGDLHEANVLSYYFDAEHPSNDLGNTIVNKFATPEFEAFVKKTYEYSQKGFISPNIQSATTINHFTPAAKAYGSYLIGTQAYAFGCEETMSHDRGIDVRMIPASSPYMDSTSVQGSMMAVSITSKHPEAALKFLNLLNTDPTAMTMLNYGLEGLTYNKNDDGTITFTDKRADYSPWTYGMGNVRILPPTDTQGTDYWNRFGTYYDAAELLPCSGFVFDPTEVEVEGAVLSNVYAEYAFDLETGAVDPDTVLPEFLEELEKGGIDAFVAEAQEQLEDFLS